MVCDLGIVILSAYLVLSVVSSAVVSAKCMEHDRLLILIDLVDRPAAVQQKRGFFDHDRMDAVRKCLVRRRIVLLCPKASYKHIAEQQYAGAKKKAENSS